MDSLIVLDSGPLGLILQRPNFAVVVQCRAWFQNQLDLGVKFFIPEIVEYEIRRELLRLGLTKPLSALDRLLIQRSTQRLILTSADFRFAADLWATPRRQGRPTADVISLDIDVILCAQVLNTKFASPPIVATSNVKHLSQFVDAREWSTI